MGKKLVKNYVYTPGVVAPGANPFPNAIELIDVNKNFIIAETIAYIQNQINNNFPPFVNYTYNSALCKRDVGYVLEAYLHDLRWGGNKDTRFVATRYWISGKAQIDGDRTPEEYAHEFVKELINTNILTNVSSTPYQTAIPQVTKTLTAEPGSTARIIELSTIIKDVIINGVSALPTLVSSQATIRIPGQYKTSDFLLITNTTRNEILYNFSDPDYAASIHYDEYADPSFPTFLQRTDGITTVTLTRDTSRHLSSDKIQIFIEDKELRIRPYDFGTDAIERMRMAAPQSMLDADFEYGLQPTKWQAIATQRGYPAIYELPGTDTPVVNVVTDASAGTSGVGASLITVTTLAPHNLVLGQPITIKALANSITGFNRAEGSFVVNSAPTASSFTYYSQAKVGTTNGQVLSTTYTQLRKAAFYTGAAIGQPTFSVFSNGASGTFTTSLGVIQGVDILPFTGTVPEVGSPLSATGIPLGTQVTAVTGPGGIAVTKNIQYSSNIGDTEINLDDASDVVAGFAVDNGTGTAVYVTAVNNLVASLSAPLTAPKKGSIGLNTMVAGQNINPAGIDATWTVERTSGTYTVTKVNSGTGYAVGDKIRLDGNQLGGNSGTNDILIRVTGVNVSTGAITTYTFSGVAASGDATYTGIFPQNLNNAGVGAQFNVVVSNTNYSVTVATAGTGYKVTDRLKFLGTAFLGTSPLNDLEIQVTSVNGSGGITGFSSVGVGPLTTATFNNVVYSTVAGGSNAQFTINRSGTSYIGVIDNGGSGYSIGETFTILGAALNGATPANNCTLTVNGVDGSGRIISLTVSGTGLDQATYNGQNGQYVTGNGCAFTVNRITGTYTLSNTSPGFNYVVGNKLKIDGGGLGGSSTVNDIEITITIINGSGGIVDFTFTGTGVSSDATYTAMMGNNRNPLGSGARFDVTRSAGVYTNVAVGDPGADYLVGDRILIDGANVEGITVTHDISIYISSTDPITGGIAGITFSGSAYPGEAVDFYSTITMSDLTSGPIVSSANVSFSAIATIKVDWPTAHGLVPGSSILVAISSSGTNHQFAGGPYFVEEIPSLTSIKYIARATGSIQTAGILGVVYPRTDSYFIHRPYDGGVQLGTGGPQHGAQAIRMSKKYIRYQSGKGIMYTTGALFAPSYDLRSATATGTTVGSFITFETDDVDHGFQVGGGIRILGIVTPGYDGEYKVVDIINERIFRVQAQKTLGSTTAQLSDQSQVSIKNWHGATVRAGAFDDQNGMFWQYDGQQLAVGRRSSTFQIAGTVSITVDTNLVTGVNTRFRDQLAVGERVVIKGMTHVVTNITSQTSMTVNPDYRGVVDAVASKMCAVRDLIVKQSDFNLDTLDKNGPSGYYLDISKMQMIGIQYSWYGAGFIDVMLRGADGNFVFAHRIRNSNVNTEAFMRTGNLPVRYEVTNESANSALLSDITASSTNLPLYDAQFFPTDGGLVYIDNEMIRYTGVSGNILTGCTREAPYTNFAAGAQRNYLAGPAAPHTARTGVVLISNTITPIISHWGSAILTDGRFDEDRGYIFNYQTTGLAVSLVKQTAFLIRLAPSVSNAIVGDLGERELLNRAQLLLQALEVTPVSGGTGSIVVEGVLNPVNFPTDPTLVTWRSLTSSGQPSFAQLAAGSSVTWNGGGSGFSASTAYASVNRQTYLYFTSASIANLRVGNAVTSSFFPGGTTVTFISGEFNSGGTLYRFIYMSQTSNGNITTGTSITFGTPAYAQPGETVFSTVSAPGSTNVLELGNLKELTNTTLGGRGTYPNGPDVLAINVYLTAGTDISTSINLRWGEAQA